MRFSNFENFKGRKGIASVVGGLFFLVLMTSGFAVSYVAIENQSAMIDTQQLIASTEIKKIQEKFAISAAADPNNNNQLQIQVKNQGYHPIEIADVWIINKTDANQPATKYELDYDDAFIPAGHGGQILENTPLYLNPDLYDIKVVSTLGTIRTAELDVVNGINNLRAELYMIPPDVKLGENATVIMYVTNTGSTLVTDVTPVNDPPISDNPTWISNSQLVSPSSIDLEPSQSGIFVWQTKLSMSGSKNSKLMFTDSVSGIESATGNTIQSNTDSDKITLRENEEGVVGFGGAAESTGSIFMEFTSFEFCEPVVDDCTSDSSDWITAWDGKMSTKYLWRINIANRGAEDLLLEQTTSLFMLHAQTQGGGNLPRTFFIKADSTPTVEDPGAYINNSKIIPKDGTPVLLYFGVEDDGSSILQETRNTPGINAVFLLIFGHEDINNNGIYDNPGDLPYSQNLAYQGLRLN